LLEGPKYITQISEELGIPYTTAQQRVAELEWAELVGVEADVDESSKRAIRLVRLANFRIELSPRSIQSIVKGEEGKVLRVV
jgi:DNA-binding Lrp family transcriptional regulator